MAWFFGILSPQGRILRAESGYPRRAVLDLMAERLALEKDESLGGKERRLKGLLRKPSNHGTRYKSLAIVSTTGKLLRDPARTTKRVFLFLYCSYHHNLYKATATPRKAGQADSTISNT